MNGNASLKSGIYQSCLDNLESQPKGAGWFSEKIQNLDSATSFYLAFGMLKRKVNEAQLVISKDLKASLITVNPAFDEGSWTLIEFCRLAFLLHLEVSDNRDKIETLLASADIKEQVVIYKSLQYLENAEDFRLAIIDGIRTNVIDVFDAIALENVYAFKFFSEAAWNQMILKAIFNERPIYRIYGVDERKNRKLAGILQDFVHERWAAGRMVTPELWRMVSGFVTSSVLEDLKKAVATDSELAKAAALKVLEESKSPEMDAWIKNEGLALPTISWDEIGLQIWKESNL